MADLVTERQQFEAALINLISNFGGGTSGEIPQARLTLIDMVKAKLDEIIPPGAQFSLDTESDINEPYSILINSLLDEAAKRVLLIAPAHALNPALSTATATQNTTDTKLGYIVLPDTFLRAISLKMADWKREVREFILTTDKRYKAQQNKFVRGGIAKPVAVLSHKKVGQLAKRVVEYYSVNSSHVIDYLFYIPETSAEDLQANLQDALTWMCAGSILQITKQTEPAKNAFEQANACLQNL